MQKPSPAALERHAIELCEGAAEYVRGQRLDARAVSSKSTTTDLVTDIDRRTEAWLTEHILRARPTDSLLGEESGGHRGEGPVRWVVDPIDGTVNFVLGLPDYAVSVAAEVDGRIVAGAVCAPVTGETFHAHLGGGAYLGSARLTGPRDVPLDRAVIGTGFAYDPDVRARQGAVVAELLPQIADIRRLGSASLDLCAVAAGRLDGYFEAGLNQWDYAAGLLIATEAGALASGLRGNPPSSEMAAVAGRSLAAEYFALLERLAADQAIGGC
jgi:myo-inositol-1(or 4)-monophosphatase